MKNIEKIQQMSAEELARIFDGTKCDYCIYGDNNEPCGNCVKSIAEWLEQEAEKPSIFEPKEGETYWSVCPDGHLTEFKNTNLSADEESIAFGNACTDRSVMERKAHDLKLWSLLWNFAEEHNGKIDWKDFDQYKCSIVKDHENGEFFIPGRGKYKHFEIYFSSKELAQRAIDEIVIPWERGEL